ncbi:type I-C CRISPR-associated protein Cas5 [Azospirillum brasilense]|uniref:pre-crRNA processing endonuclease n=2 Tax=Azospirillum brasilense TaxID=192 RepID=A0A6L3B6F6_AZOBR|nr:type I-C CRISPR-associated protein Cas5c [Azospirillum brasilense]KAA0688213.1 type I-C CRISPR-associated protein Cas5 [Azospirillum brasilense]
MSYGIKLRVSGPRACFTRPETKVERVSYDVITPSAARGILEAIHWKPAIVWTIDRIHVLKPIRFQSLRRNEVGHKVPVATVRHAMRGNDIAELRQIADHDRQQRAAVILVDVDYIIEAHVSLTEEAGENDTIATHLKIFNRRAQRGQCFHQPCLGTREFPAEFELWEGPVPVHALPGEQRNLDLGPMLLDIDHSNGRSSLIFHAVLREGVLAVPPRSLPEVRA